MLLQTLTTGRFGSVLLFCFLVAGATVAAGCSLPGRVEGPVKRIQLVEVRVDVLRASGRRDHRHHGQGQEALRAG